MTNKRQMTIVRMAKIATTGRDGDVNFWVDMRMTEATSRGRELAEEARVTRLARVAATRSGEQPSLRDRFGAAVAAWKQPGRLAA